LLRQFCLFGLLINFRLDFLLDLLLVLFFRLGLCIRYSCGGFERRSLERLVGDGFC